MTKQRAWQLKMIAEGRCTKCGSYDLAVSKLGTRKLQQCWFHVAESLRRYQREKVSR